MVAADLRERIHGVVDQLPRERLADTLHFMELMLAAPEDADVEPEEMWLLATGALKRLVDGIDDEQPPLEDWRSWRR